MIIFKLVRSEFSISVYYSLLFIGFITAILDLIELKLKNKGFEHIDILGDIIISINQVEKQAIEYGHSFERELSYMVVHGFYHLMGYDHMEEEEKKIMRSKEEIVLNELEITR